VAELFGLDTNVLVYTAATDDPARCERATDIVTRAVASGRCVLATQNVIEFVAVTSRRRGGGVPLLPPEAAAARARDLMVMFPALARPDRNSVLAALAEAVAGRASWWDAMLAATLAGAGCTVLLSEDMHDGGTLAGLTIRNPFAGDELPEAVANLLNVPDARVVEEPELPEAVAAGGEWRNLEPEHPASDPRTCVVDGQSITYGELIAGIGEGWAALGRAAQRAHRGGFRIGVRITAGGGLMVKVRTPNGDEAVLDPDGHQAPDVERDVANAFKDLSDGLNAAAAATEFLRECGGDVRITQQQDGKLVADGRTPAGRPFKLGGESADEPAELH
jgi:predicted nucleic acid-binding protein